MRFRVYKATDGASNRSIKPCEGAVWGKYLYTETRRGVGFPDEYSWYGFGINHRETEMGIARDLEMEDWFITISDLHEIDVFMQTNGYPVTLKIEPEYYGFSHTLIIRNDGTL